MQALDDLPAEKLLGMYRSMLTIRTFEVQAKLLVESGDVPGEIHQYVGEEAVAAGVCSALDGKDVITSTHRGHGHIIAKGGDVRLMMAELLGKREGYCHGKGGSMHIASIGLGIYGANGIVAAGAPIATGAALASKRKGTGVVSVAFFGDGGANAGALHESMNLASIFKLPVIFVCENNGYAVSFSTRESTSVENIASRAAGYGMPGFSIDGMDVLAVHRAAKEAVERARAGIGPSYIEAKTYRFVGHYSAEETVLAGNKYRSDEEVKTWMARDPIERFGALLLSKGVTTERQLSSIKADVESLIAGAVDFAKAGQAPEPEDAFSDLYSSPHPHAVPRGW